MIAPGTAAVVTLPMAKVNSIDVKRPLEFKDVRNASSGKKVNMDRDKALEEHPLFGRDENGKLQPVKENWVLHPDGTPKMPRYRLVDGQGNRISMAKDGETARASATEIRMRLVNTIKNMKNASPAAKDQALKHWESLAEALDDYSKNSSANAEKLRALTGGKTLSQTMADIGYAIQVSIKFGK